MVTKVTSTLPFVFPTLHSQERRTTAYAQTILQPSIYSGSGKIGKVIQRIYKEIAGGLYTLWLLFKRCLGLQEKITVPSTHPHKVAIQQLLNQGSTFDSYTLGVCFQMLLKTYPHVRLATPYGYLIPCDSIDFTPQSYPSNALVLYPVFLPGLFGSTGHFTLLFVDNTRKLVGYFDSSGDKIPREGLLKEIKELHFPRDSSAQILQNTTCHQFDPVNCGIYILDAAKRLATGESFEHICAHGTSRVQIEKRRIGFAEALLKNTAQNGVFAA